ncbi:monocarboxylate transporter 14 [Caerostris extrusa]|uniref:Monocarboxylate transporter 14 n=1 Tax=Caerostris extrusa TaxID=172846 RepID=A0AAV4S246_CAEEX|nr:monocarboxylate transporter 14 [Caerostris extrusa]
MGVANAAGKIMLGLCVDRASFSVLVVFVLCLVIGGIFTAMVSLYTQYYQIALYSCIFGVTWGGTLGLTPVLLVELLGKAKLNNAYGLHMMITGIALFVGTPITGKLDYYKPLKSANSMSYFGNDDVNKFSGV